MIYPRILIIGQYFDTRSGGGITMTNLFKGWDIENIAAAAENIQNPTFDICTNYYKMGSSEFRMRFPFSLKPWREKIESGAVIKNKNSVYTCYFSEKKKVESKSVYSRFIELTGLDDYRSKYIISKELLSWIKEFSPDIIYSQLSSIKLIDFVSHLQETLELPLAIHIMDDWPSIIGKNGIFQNIRHKMADKKFRKLLSNSKVLLSISEEMSAEYEIRYGKRFIPFHNPIELKFWGATIKTNYEMNESFKILYAGRIGQGIQNCFFDVAKAIENLRKKGPIIELNIQSTSINPILEDLTQFDFIKLNDSVPYSELPSILAKADLLLLPNDFDEKSVAFLRYSMPTKASEYMISGTPILLYSSEATAVAKHAIKNNWAYVVSDNKIEILESAIFELYQNTELRKRFAETAKDYAMKHFESRKVREEFRNSLISAS